MFESIIKFLAFSTNSNDDKKTVTLNNNEDIPLKNKNRIKLLK